MIMTSLSVNNKEMHVIVSMPNISIQNFLFLDKMRDQLYQCLERIFLDRTHILDIKQDGTMQNLVSNKKYLKNWITNLEETITYLTLIMSKKTTKINGMSWLMFLYFHLPQTLPSRRNLSNSKIYLSITA